MSRGRYIIDGLRPAPMLVGQLQFKDSVGDPFEVIGEVLLSFVDVGVVVQVAEPVNRKTNSQ